jgi:hypothetical protein
LKEVINTVDVDELWVMNIDPLRRFVEDPANYRIKYPREVMHFLECITTAHQAIHTAKGKNVTCNSVYEGYRKRIGPFLIEVLSPSPSFNRFLNNPKNIEKILARPKGRTYERYLIEKGHASEDVSTEICIEPIEENEDHETERTREYRTGTSEYNEEALLENFDLASRSLLNDVSTVVRITCLAGYLPAHASKAFTMLFPGDLEDWSYIILKYDQYINTFVLKVPHHGSGRVEFKEQSLYHFLRPHLSLVFPYPAKKLPTQEAIALLAHSGLVSCSSFKRTTAAGSSSSCCHINNECVQLDKVIYEVTPYGLSVTNGQSICIGMLRL